MLLDKFFYLVIFSPFCKNVRYAISDVAMGGPSRTHRTWPHRILCGFLMYNPLNSHQ